MIPKDSLVKYIDNKNNMRVIATNATITVDDARIRHRLSPIPAIALGRLLVGSLLMASTLKDHAVVTLQVSGDGPLNFLTADASYEGYVRGYCSAPDLDVPIARKGWNIAQWIGKGLFSVKKMIEENTKPYTGIVPLYTGEIGEDIAYYYFHSEQIPTAISLGVYFGKEGDITAAGGILVQAMPPQEDNFLESLGTIFSKSPSISEIIGQGADADGIVQAYLPGYSLEHMSTISPMFKCTCNKSKSEKAFFTFGAEEVKSMIDEEGKIDIVCDYCGQNYFFEKEDLEKILKKIQASQVNPPKN